MPTQVIYFKNEILLRLRKEENMSALISELLTEYFKKNDLNNMSVEELDKRIKIVELKEEAEKLEKEVLTNAIK